MWSPILQAVGLIIAVVTLYIGAMRLKEKRLDRKRPIIKDILEQEVYHDLEVIEDNREFLKSEESDWIQDKPDTGNSEDILFTDLRALSLRNSDQIVSEKFSEIYPEVVDTLNKHDKLLVSVEKAAFDLIRSCRDPLSEYIEYRNITDEDGSLVSADELLNYVLIGDRPARYDERPDYWEDYAIEIKTICASHNREAYDKFYRMKTKYKNYTNDVEQELTQIRDELETTYGAGRYA
jgi:hypothetical protein